jgi:hypothetical protein
MEINLERYRLSCFFSIMPTNNSDRQVENPSDFNQSIIYIVQTRYYYSINDSSWSGRSAAFPVNKLFNDQQHQLARSRSGLKNTSFRAVFLEQTIASGEGCRTWSVHRDSRQLLFGIRPVCRVRYPACRFGVPLLLH